MDRTSSVLFSDEIPVSAKWDTEDIAHARACQQLFNRSVTPAEVAYNLGAPAGADVKITGSGTTSAFVNVVIDCKNPEVYWYSDFSTGSFGVYADIGSVRISPPRQGYGARIFLEFLEGCRAFTVPRIELDAAGGPQSSTDNGYYTWPRFGFDMRLQPDAVILAGLAGFMDVASTNELFLAYESDAIDWWRRNGHSGRAQFATDPGSRSSRIFEAYLADNMIDVGASIERPEKSN